jgi:uncharacterized 2Fe-2S/4Fe-4S cluster protein (DUF4445 family)
MRVMENDLNTSEEKSAGTCLVSFGPGVKAPTPGGSSLLSVIRRVGLPFEAPCDGKGICGKCRVIAGGAVSLPDIEELDHLGDQVNEMVRLACQAKVLGPVSIRLVEDQVQAPQIVEKGERRWTALNPATRRRVLSGTDEDMASSTPLCSRFLSEGINEPSPEMACTIMRHLAQESQAECHPYLEAVTRDDRLLALRFHQAGRILGIALDIGTTTIVAELVDLESGETVDVRSSLNPQTVFGGDVLTRISYGMDQPDGIETMRESIIEGVNKMILHLCSAHGLNDDEIFEAVVAGNTTMLHLMLGVDAGSLARAPFRPVFTRQLRLSPGKDGRLVGTSSAAGPALEGMNISCGCRAAEGAIQGVEIAENGDIVLDVVGNTSPKGICGSGLIDLIAAMLRRGLIEPDGRLAEKHNLPGDLAGRIVDNGGQKAFVVSKNENVFLSQKDIRQVQLAKSAMATGIALLLKELDIAYQDVRRILVAGAFGSHLKPSSLSAIGLLPWEPPAKVDFVGNTAKEGARMVLVNSGCSRQVDCVAAKLTIMELSMLSDFQSYFLRNLNFPDFR